MNNASVYCDVAETVMKETGRWSRPTEIRLLPRWKVEGKSEEGIWSACRRRTGKSTGWKSLFSNVFEGCNEGYAFMLISLMIALIFVEKSTILLF